VVAHRDDHHTPIDPAVTPCDSSGCSHTSSDDQMQIEMSAGAIPPGDQVQVTATEFDQVEYLPSGELPEGTWETYAFNVGGDSDYEFQQPIMVRLRNSRGFAPGSEIPLGYWNQHTIWNANTSTYSAFALT
jgi:chitodextrinase